MVTMTLGNLRRFKSDLVRFKGQDYLLMSKPDSPLGRSGALFTPESLEGPDDKVMEFDDAFAWFEDGHGVFRHGEQIGTVADVQPCVTQ